MTGLDVENDKIMEVACLVTDSNLNIIAKHPEIVIYQPLDILNRMDDWCTKQHRMVGIFQSYILFCYGLPT